MIFNQKVNPLTAKPAKINRKGRKVLRKGYKGNRRTRVIFSSSPGLLVS